MDRSAEQMGKGTEGRLLGEETPHGEVGRLWWNKESGCVSIKAVTAEKENCEQSGD